MLDDILLFTELAEHKSFSKAANNLNIGQSTLSKRIANLEQELKLNLIVHHTRKFEITPDGEVLYQKFKHLRQYLKDNINVLQNRNTDYKTTLKVSISTSLGYDILCPYVYEFMEQNPTLSLELFFQHENNEQALEYFDIVITNYPIKDNIVECIPLISEVAHLYCTPQYKEKYGTPEQIHDLDNHRFIGVMSNFPVGAPKTITFKHRYKKYEFVYDNLKAQLKSNLPAHLKRMGMAGDYIFGSWKSVCYEEIKNGTLLTVLEDYYTYPTEFYLTVHKNYGLAEKKFIDFLRYCINKTI